MGAFERKTDLRNNNTIDSNRTQIVAGLMALIALFAPVATSGYNYGYSFYLMITAMTWSISIDGLNPIRFDFIPPYALLGMIPFLLFRAGSLYQIIRYYQGKTTKGWARIAAFISDAPFLIVYSFLIIFGGFYGGIQLNFPLPIMMVVGLILLWRFPVHEATVPWEGMSDPVPWWVEEKPEERTETSADNQPW
jgi:drug/metabolite transporter superfamily protein YnfA